MNWWERDAARDDQHAEQLRYESGNFGIGLDDSKRTSPLDESDDEPSKSGDGN